jgi:hypothetical protein
VLFVADDVDAGDGDNDGTVEDAIVEDVNRVGTVLDEDA